MVIQASTSTAVGPTKTWYQTDEVFYGLAVAGGVLVLGGSLSAAYIVRAERRRAARRVGAEAREEGDITERQVAWA